MGPMLQLHSPPKYSSTASLETCKLLSLQWYPKSWSPITLNPKIINEDSYSSSTPDQPSLFHIYQLTTNLGEARNNNVDRTYAKYLGQTSLSHIPLPSFSQVMPV